MFDEYKLDLQILCIDFKSFYATVECIDRNLDPLNTPLIVSDASRGNGAITLAVSPFLKQKYGIKSRSRLFELPKGIDDLIIAKPQMSKYVQMSKDVISFYLTLFDRNDIYIYSIDEVFIDVTNYLKLYKCTARELATKLLASIYKKFGLYSTCGIGKNMLLAKYALDIDSKHNEDWIAEWDYDSIETRLWPVTKLTDVWGIGRRMEKNLHADGVSSVKDIVELGIDYLYNKYGIMGEELYLHCHGIDISRIQDQQLVRKRKSYGIGQTLFENYYNNDVLVVLKEMAYEETLKLKNDGYSCKTVTVSMSFDNRSLTKGASKQIKLLNPTNDYRKILAQVTKIFNLIYTNDVGVRKLSITLSNLVSSNIEQLSLFDDNSRDNAKLEDAIIELRNKFGKDSVLLSISAEEKATTKFRNTLIGGHNA